MAESRSPAVANSHAQRKVTIDSSGQDRVALAPAEVGWLEAQREPLAPRSFGHSSSEAATSSRCERACRSSAPGARWESVAFDSVD